MLILRSLLFNIYLYILTVVMAIGVIPTFFLPRIAIQRAFRLWAKLVLAGQRLICGTRLEIRGLENLPRGAALVASKHQSMWDTIVFGAILPDPAYVLKKELSYIPLYGWYALKMGMVSIDRAAHAAAVRKLVNGAQKLIDAGRQVIIFPEGHRMPPGAPPDYKVGVAALYTKIGAPCVPVALNSGLFWPRRQFLRKPGTIVLEFLEPIPPGLKRRDFTARLETAIETATDRLLAEAGHPVTRPEPGKTLGTSAEEPAEKHVETAR